MKQNRNEGKWYKIMKTNKISLLKRIYEEQEYFRSWLQTQAPEEILGHACEFTVREDIIMAMGNLDLSEAEAEVLLSLPSPLADFYKDYEKLETDYMDSIQDCLKDRIAYMMKAR